MNRPIIFGVLFAGLFGYSLAAVAQSKPTVSPHPNVITAPAPIITGSKPAANPAAVHNTSPTVVFGDSKTDAYAAPKLATLCTPYYGALTAEQQTRLAQMTKLYKRVRVVQLSANTLQADNLALNLFPEISDVYNKTDIGETGIKMPSWNGFMASKLGSASFVINGSRVSAHIACTDYNIEISPLGMEQTDIHIIFEHDVNALEQQDKCPMEGDLHRNGNTVEPPYDPASEGKSASAERNLAPNGYECFIRIIVGYTPAAKAGTLADFSRTMNEHVALCVAQSNTGHAQSGAEQRWELAHLYQAAAERNVHDDQDMNNDITSLQGIADGKWDEIHTLRTRYDADCVVMMRIQEPQSGGTLFGLAYAFDYTASTNMFCLVSYNTGTTLFTFAHEIGHTMGCRHQNDGTNTPFAHGHGKCNASYRSILGTNSCGGTRLNYWSNPTINDPNGVSLGTVGTAEVYRALNDGDFTVAHHRTTTAAWTTSSPTYDISGDGQYSSYATGTMTATNVIGSGAVADIKSATIVILSPGFVASAGSNTHIYIQNSCAATYSRQANADENGTANGTADASKLDNSAIHSLNGVSLTVFPNPFDATTTIEYNLNREQEVGLVLYNTLGQVVQVLQTPQLKAEGSNKLTLQAADLAGGIYYVVMTSEQGKMTYKVILNK